MNLDSPSSSPPGPYNTRAAAKETAEQLALTNLQLTADEYRVLKECQQNAIFQRGLPLALVSSGSFYFLMKKGMIQRNNFSLAISGLTGFLLGTMSYRKICMDKLLAIPNSSLKERILAAQGKVPQFRVEMQPQDSQSQSWFDPTPPPAPQTPQNPPALISSLDIDPYQANRFDEFSSASVNRETGYAINPPLQPTEGVPYSTYDELRQRNRDQYNYNNRPPGRLDPRYDPYQQPLPRYGAPQQPPPPSQPGYGAPQQPPQSYQTQPPDNRYYNQQPPAPKKDDWSW